MKEKKRCNLYQIEKEGKIERKREGEWKKAKRNDSILNWSPLVITLRHCC